MVRQGFPSPLTAAGIFGCFEFHRGKLEEAGEAHSLVALVDSPASILLRATFLRLLAVGLPPACIGQVSAENSPDGCAPPVAAVAQAELVFLDEPATLLVPWHFDAPQLDGCYAVTKGLLAPAEHI